jgi:hypothetical protein
MPIPLTGVSGWAGRPRENGEVTPEKSKKSNRGERVKNLKSEIEKLDAGVAKGKLIELRNHIDGAPRNGFLRLDGSGSGGDVSFSTHSWKGWGKSAKGEVTGAALKALFDKAGYNTRELENYLTKTGNNRISAARVKELISDAELENSLKQYRRVQVGDVEVGGSSRPAGNNLLNGITQDGVLGNIRNAGYGTILSIDDGQETRNIEQAIQNQGFNHILDANLTVRDFTTPTYKQMANIHQRIENEADAGRNVLIHCGAGGGRTGTVLASLVLRDLVQAELRNNPQFWQVIDPNLSVSLDYDVNGYKRDFSYLGVTPLVKQAIDTIRQKDSSEKSVETPEQVAELMKYQYFLTKDNATPDIRITLASFGMFS